MEPDYQKALLALVSVFAGWILAQVTGIVRDRLRERKIRRCLHEELCELKRELERTKLIYKRQLQVHSLQGINNGSPARLSNHIFRNYYKDAVLGLNTNQRISFQMIHTLVEMINDGVDEYRKLTAELLEKNMLGGGKGLLKVDGERWGSKVTSEYRNVSNALWHVNFHLNNRKSPDLSSYTKHHEDYLKHLDSVTENIAQIMSSAKSLKREDFEKAYDPAYFRE